MRFVNRITLLAMLGLVTAAFPMIADARQVEIWSYERLFKESDLIVIAKAEETIQSDDRAKDPLWVSIFVGQNTTFKIQSVLKGKAAEDLLTVLHFKLKEGAVPQYGPMLVTFRIKEIHVSGVSGETLHKFEATLAQPDYLLFLKASSKGRFEPISGQIDPKLSVKEIYNPIPAVVFN